MADLPRCVEWSIRVYKTLIKAYPGSFHKEYGDEMTLVFRELAFDAYQRRRVFGLLVVWLRVFGDLAISAPREHWTARKTHEGGTAMTLKSLLTRDLMSNEAIQRWRWVRFLMILFIFLPGLPTIGKFQSMNLTEAQWFLAILVTVALGLQSLGVILLGIFWEPKVHSRVHDHPGEVVIYVASILAVILGVWKLASMAITEYELIVGILLLFQVYIAICLLALVHKIIRTASSDNADTNAAAKSALGSG